MKRSLRRARVTASVLLASWITKLWLFPVSPVDLSEFIRRASVRPFSGQAVIGLGMLFYAGWLCWRLAHQHDPGNG